MHHCVQELFGDPSEPDSEKLECLAKLLTSIGKKLDRGSLGQERVGQVHEGLLQAAQEAREQQGLGCAVALRSQRSRS